MARASDYRNPYPLPTVNGMLTAGGSDYNATPTEKFGENVKPFFPTSWLGRIQTPVARVAVSGSFSIGSYDPRHPRPRAGGC